MVHTYTPTYYSTIHDSITSLCKTILPFSLKKRRLTAAEHRLSKLQSDNLKWQQDSFHQILRLMGLHKEGILAETEVSAFRSHLLDTLIASPLEREHPVILRDKLVFLQELLYAKCISEDEYHSSKRPLLQRLAVQGAEIEARDVIVASQRVNPKETSPEEEWSVIDLKDENSACKKEALRSKSKSKHGSALKQIKGAGASVLGFVSSHRHGKGKDERSIFVIEAERSASASVSAASNNEIYSFDQNAFWNSSQKKKECETESILMQESLPHDAPNRNCQNSDKGKRKPFRALFSRDGGDSEENGPKSAKKQWGSEGFSKWKKNDKEDETSPLRFGEISNGESSFDSYNLATSPVGEGPDTKQIKKKLLQDGSPSDFFIDKVVGDKIKKELSRIQSELYTTNPNFKFSNDQIEAISTKLPVEKAELNDFFPRSWCDRYGEVVLDVVKKEFRDHIGEMECKRTATKEKRRAYATQWTTFEDAHDDENRHPNLFARENHAFSSDKNSSSPWNRDVSFNNPFWSPVQ